MGTSCSTPASPHGGVAELVAAGGRGDVALCLAILKDRSDLVSRAPLAGVGNTVIHAAVAHVNVLEAIVEFMRSEALAASLLAEPKQGDKAAPQRPGDAQLCQVQRVLSRVLDVTNGHGQTPLMLACRGGHPESVRFLLLQGADPWVVDKHGARTALHHAALAGHAVCIKALLTTVRKTSRYIDTRTICGFSPLHCAVAVGSADAVRALLPHGPNIYACNVFPPPHFRIRCPMQTTVLHMAAINGNIGVVMALLKYYLERSAVVSMNDPRRLQDGEEQLPYQVAARRGHHHLVRLLDPRQRLLGEVFRPEDLDAVPGFPQLRMLAGTALRNRLLSSLDRLAVHPASAAQAPSTSGTAVEPAGEGVTPAATAVTSVPASLPMDVPRGGRAVSPAGATTSSLPLAAAFSCAGTVPTSSSSAPQDSPVSLSYIASAFEEDSTDLAPTRSAVDSGTAAGIADSDGGDSDDEPAAISAPRGAGGRAERCGICLDQHQSVAVAGCAHRLCRRCARTLARQVHDRISPCPFCRRPIGDFVAMAVGV